MDLSITAFRVEGMTSDVLKNIVLNSWLSAGGTGVTTSTTTVEGRTATKVDYGDGGAPSYVVINGDIVFVGRNLGCDPRKRGRRGAAGSG